MGVSQEQIYAGLDLELSWSESDLPERERTKHVHRLHPYLGKYIPQLVEELLRPLRPAGGRVLDPFAGSGTTLVQALESGLDSTGVDVAAFNCLLMRVKTARTTRSSSSAICATRSPASRRGGCRRQARRRTSANGSRRRRATSCSLPLARRATTSTQTCCGSCSPAPPGRRGGRPISTSTSRRAPQLEPYWCYKHKRECRPVERAEHFIRRYALDTLARLKEFARVRGRRARERAARRRARARLRPARSTPSSPRRRIRA